MAQCEFFQPVSGNRIKLHRAKLIAHLLSGIYDIERVALSGSLARNENANDIDLVVLHNFSEGEAFTLHINCPEKAERKEKLPRHTLSAQMLNLVETACAGEKADLIFIPSLALNYCYTLERISAGERGPHFYKTLLCEIPLLPFDAQSCEFKNKSLRHGIDGKCCFPAETWEERRERVKRYSPIEDDVDDEWCS